MLLCFAVSLLRVNDGRSWHYAWYKVSVWVRKMLIGPCSVSGNMSLLCQRPSGMCIHFTIILFARFVWEEYFAFSEPVDGWLFTCDYRKRYVNPYDRTDNVQQAEELKQMNEENNLSLTSRSAVYLSLLSRSSVHDRTESVLIVFVLWISLLLRLWIFFFDFFIYELQQWKLLSAAYKLCDWFSCLYKLEICCTN